MTVYDPMHIFIFFLLIYKKGPFFQPSTESLTSHKNSYLCYCIISAQKNAILPFRVFFLFVFFSFGVLVTFFQCSVCLIRFSCYYYEAFIRCESNTALLQTKVCYLLQWGKIKGPVALWGNKTLKQCLTREINTIKLNTGIQCEILQD